MIFAHPKLLWLLIILPPALAAFLWWAGRLRQRLLTAFIQARLLPHLTVGLSREREVVRGILLTAACATLIVAMARPQWGFTWEETRQKGLDIVLAIDTSKSMLAEDIAPNRLARAKLAALDLMQVAKSDRLGLVAFAGGAFLQCPMTIDDAAFRQSVDLLDVNTIPQGGTAIAEAIETAAAAFKEGDSHKVLVILTDGEDQDSNAVAAARRAAETGLRIFTIGIGSPEGELLPVRDAKGRTDYIKDESGNVVKSRLNERMLQDIAAAGNGFYLPMRGAEVVETLYKNGLAPLPKSESESKLYKHYHEQFHWPLALGVLLLVMEILLPVRSGAKTSGRATAMSAEAKVSASLLFAMLVSAFTASASTASALKDYHSGRYQQALDEYTRLMQKKADDPRLALNAGTAAYRDGSLDRAESFLSKAVNAPDLTVQQQAYYNRGNTRFQTGEAAQEPEAKKSAWEKSLQDFESAIKLNDKDADAKHNYEFVKQKLEELKQQQQKQEQQEDQNQQNQKDDQQQKQDQTQKDQQQQQSNPQENQQDSTSQKQDKSDQPSKEDQKQQQPDEQKDQKKPQEQPQQSKPEDSNQKKSGDPQQQSNAQRDPNQMTPEQAMRVLDTMKGDEQMLPVQPVEAAPSIDRKLKDW